MQFILRNGLSQKVLPIVADQKGGLSDVSGDFCQRIVGLVCVGILHGARLGAWYVGHGAIDGDGVARAAVTLH